MADENDLTDLAKKAGITADDLNFLRDLVAKMFLGRVLGLRLYSVEDMNKVLLMFDKLQEVEPEVVPTEMAEALSTVRQFCEGKA